MYYIKLAKNDYDFTDLKVETAYTKGGFNYFTYKEEPRGYYLHVTPVKRDGCCETYTAFSGVKTLIKSANRLSKKTLAELISEESERASTAITYLCDKYNLKRDI